MKSIVLTVRIHTSAKHHANVRMEEFVTRLVELALVSLDGMVKFVEIDAYQEDMG